ncbi:MAG TPA: sigma-70 family RNA polymerase sigma factor [Steroidobacteraceae bacterium]
MRDLKDQGLVRLLADSRAALSRYVRRLVRSRSVAEEIVQETWLRAYLHREQVDVRAPYLFSIARNLAFKARRHDRVVDAFAVRDAYSAELYGTCASAEDAAIADERLQILEEAIRSLPPQCRAVFTLRMFQDRSYKEIAAQLNISARTVEKHVALGTLHVHAALTKRYKDVSSS